MARTIEQVRALCAASNVKPTALPEVAFIEGIPPAYAAHLLFTAYTSAMVEIDLDQQAQAFADFAEIFSSNRWREIVAFRPGGTLRVLGWLDSEAENEAIEEFITGPAWAAVAMGGAHELRGLYFLRDRTIYLLAMNDEGYDGGLLFEYEFTKG